MSKYDEWKDRKEGFDRHVNIVTSKRNAEDAIKSGQESPADPKENLINLAVFLSEFTTKLFDFFLEGFSGFLGSDKPQALKLIPSAEYPPEYVLQKILQQASFDLTVIQRAIEQRKNDILRSDLERYDELARLALSIAFPDPDKTESWLIDPVKPFVYFQRDTSVRIIPYANALLIGVPFSTLCQPIDLLSIPHEIGHHVYEAGKFSATEPIYLFFQKYFADKPDWIQNWLEEIFADLYGFLVAGPIVGFSLQEILLDNLPKYLMEDDGDHPAGIIRPLTFSKLFLSQRFNGGPGAEKTETALRERWQNEGKRRGLANTFKPVTGSNSIDGAGAGTILGSVLREMNEQMNMKTKDAFRFPASLDPENNLQPWTLFPGGGSFNSAEGQSEFDPDKPFAQFSVGEVISSRKTQVDKMTRLLDDSKFELSRVDQNAYWLKNQIDYWNNQHNLPALPPNIWKLIFTAFNWADKPTDDTRPVHGPETIPSEYIR